MDHSELDALRVLSSAGQPAPAESGHATQRYRRMADRLGINTTLKNLRHYTATELISGGVDVRTVAGRLGHGGGGATTPSVSMPLGHRRLTSELPGLSAAGYQHCPEASPISPLEPDSQRHLSTPRPTRHI